MIQLDFFRTTERVELGVDCFDISKVKLDITYESIQHNNLANSVRLLNALPSDVFIMYKTGAHHNDVKKYPDPIYPYLYDHERNAQLAINDSRCPYPGFRIPTRHMKNVPNVPKTFSILVHRLAAMCFLENDEPNAKTTVDHINEDKWDYRVENLEWVTLSENTQRTKNK